MLYGPAGAGKTTLLLTITRNQCNEYTCIYVSTEETLHYDRVAKNIDDYSKVYFVEAYTMDELIKTVLVASLIKPRHVFIDTVNALLRLEAYKKNTIMKQVFIIGLLYNMVEESGGKLFASAQVRTIDEGGIEASGYRLLDYYFDSIIGVFIGEGEYRYIKPMKTPIRVDFEKQMFKITDIGVEWLDRSS